MRPITAIVSTANQLSRSKSLSTFYVQILKSAYQILLIKKILSILPPQSYSVGLVFDSFILALTILSLGQQSSIARSLAAHPSHRYSDNHPFFPDFIKLISSLSADSEDVCLSIDHLMLRRRLFDCALIYILLPFLFLLAYLMSFSLPVYMYMGVLSLCLYNRLLCTVSARAALESIGALSSLRFVEMLSVLLSFSLLLVFSYFFPTIPLSAPILLLFYASFAVLPLFLASLPFTNLLRRPAFSTHNNTSELQISRSFTHPVCFAVSADKDARRVALSSLLAQASSLFVSFATISFLSSASSSLFLFLLRIYSFLSSFSNALFYSSIPKISHINVKFGLRYAYNFGVKRLQFSLSFSYLVFLVFSPFLLSFMHFFLPNGSYDPLGEPLHFFFALYAFSVVERLGAFSLHLNACLTSFFNVVPNILYFCALVILFCVLTRFLGASGSLISLVVSSLFFYAIPSLFLLVRFRDSFLASR